MSDFVPLKDILAKAIITRAKERAWNTFSKAQQDAFLKEAELIQNIENVALAKKCWDEANAAFNAPGFISRADPRAYSDHPESETAKKRSPRKK